MFVAHQFAVIELGRFELQRAVKKQLAGSREQEIGAAHDFRDLHRMVVGDAGELIRWQIIVTPNHEIAEFAAGHERLCSEGTVVEVDYFAVGNAEAPIHARAAWDFFNTVLTARAGINRFFLTLVGRLKRAENILSRTGARIKEPARAQPIKFGAVEFDAFALIVRRVRAANIRTFIPGKAEPFQVFDKSGDEFRARAGAIKIFITKDELASGNEGAFLRRPESPGMAEMEQAGGRRRESPAIDFGR